MTKLKMENVPGNSKSGARVGGGCSSTVHPLTLQNEGTEAPERGVTCQVCDRNKTRAQPPFWWSTVDWVIRQRILSCENSLALQCFLSLGDVAFQRPSLWNSLTWDCLRLLIGVNMPFLQPFKNKGFWPSGFEMLIWRNWIKRL